MEEPEVTPRKILIGVVCLLGSAFVPYVEATTGPLMMLPMIQELGWTRTQYAFGTTFMFISGAVSVLAFGRIADRFGSRTILLLGSVGGGITMLALSRQGTQLWQLYLAYALLGACGSSGLGYTKIIGTLFAKHRGKALAIFGAESTLALAMLPLLTSALNERLGWRGTYVVYAIIMFALSPVLYFVIRGPGLSQPAGGNGPVGAVAVAPPAAAEGLTPAEIRRDRAFWLVVLAAVLCSGLNAGLTAHIIAAVADKGFSQATAAGVLSAATFIGLAGTLAVGVAMDYFRTAKVMAIFALLMSVGALVFGLSSAAAGGLALLVVGLGIQRIGFHAMMPGTSYMQTRFVGMRSFGEAFAMQVVALSIGMAFAPPLFGMIYDRTGSYEAMYWIVAGGALAGACVYLALGPYRYKAGGR
jgi:MFS family permease